MDAALPHGSDAWPAWRPDSVFVQAGASARDAQVATLGLRWGWAAPARAWGPGWSGAWELGLGRWSAGVGVPADRREHPLQLSWMPLARWRAGGGASPWFVEGGLGLSLHDRPYRVGRVEQGSRWNFHEALALGRSLGPQGRDELSLRLAHLSNAGLRRPNPGETWWALRWQRAW